MAEAPATATIILNKLSESIRAMLLRWETGDKDPDGNNEPSSRTTYTTTMECKNSNNHQNNNKNDEEVPHHHHHDDDDSSSSKDSSNFDDDDLVEENDDDDVEEIIRVEADEDSMNRLYWRKMAEHMELVRRNRECLWLCLQSSMTTTTNPIATDSLLVESSSTKNNNNNNDDSTSFGPSLPISPFPQVPPGMSTGGRTPSSTAVMVGSNRFYYKGKLMKQPNRTPLKTRRIYTRSIAAPGRFQNNLVVGANFHPMSSNQSTRSPLPSQSRRLHTPQSVHQHWRTVFQDDEADDATTTYYDEEQPSSSLSFPCDHSYEAKQNNHWNKSISYHRDLKEMDDSTVADPDDQGEETSLHAEKQCHHQRDEQKSNHASTGSCSEPEEQASSSSSSSLSSTSPSPWLTANSPASTDIPAPKDEEMHPGIRPIESNTKTTATRNTATENAETNHSLHDMSNSSPDASKLPVIINPASSSMEALSTVETNDTITASDAASASTNPEYDQTITLDRRTLLQQSQRPSRSFDTSFSSLGSSHYSSATMMKLLLHSSNRNMNSDLNSGSRKDAGGSYNDDEVEDGDVTLLLLDGSLKMDSSKFYYQGHQPDYH